ATETFQYDGASRLVQAGVTGRTPEVYSYDSIGNMTFASDTRPTPSCANGATFAYRGSTVATEAAGPHAVTDIICDSSDIVLHHDALGNHVSGLDSHDAYTWTTFGKLASHTSASAAWALTYDADHQRVEKHLTSTSRDPNVPFTQIVYAGEL